MSEKVKPYLGTTNSINTVLVITTSKKRVSELVGVSLYMINTYWTNPSWNWIEKQNHNFEPHVVYIGEHKLGEDPKWTEFKLFINDIKMLLKELKGVK